MLTANFEVSCLKSLCNKRLQGAAQCLRRTSFEIGAGSAVGCTATSTPEDDGAADPTPADDGRAVSAGSAGSAAVCDVGGSGPAGSAVSDVAAGVAAAAAAGLLVVVLGAPSITQFGAAAGCVCNRTSKLCRGGFQRQPSASTPHSLSRAVARQGPISDKNSSARGLISDHFLDFALSPVWPNRHESCTRAESKGSWIFLHLLQIFLMMELMPSFLLTSNSEVSSWECVLLIPFEDASDATMGD